MSLARKPDVDLMVFDIDNTLVPTTQTMAEVYRVGLEHWAKARHTTPAALAATVKAAMETQNASGHVPTEKSIPWHIMHDPSRLPELVPALGPPRPEDREAVLAMAKKRSEGLVFAPEAIETLRQAHERGIPVVFLTNGSKDTVSHRLARAMQAAEKSGALPPGVKVTDLVQEIVGLENYATRAGDRPPPHKVVDPALQPFLDDVGAKFRALPRNAAKPNTEGLLDLIERNHAAREKTWMIGDGWADGLVAKRVGCRFAWQREGATLKPWADRLLNDETGFPGEPIGRRRTQERMREDGIRPDLVLAGGMGDLGSWLRTGRVPGHLALGVALGGSRGAEAGRTS